VSGLRSGYVALVGWTNVGKSTLLNRLVGEKIAAVSDVPQTTRGRILAARTEPGRGQALFVDTPGFHRPKHRLNEAMVEVARHAIDGVDLAALVVDGSRDVGPGDLTTARFLAKARAARICVLNKIDLVAPKSLLLPRIATLAGEGGIEEVIPVSAATGEGCDVLLDRVFALLPEGDPPFDDDYLTDQPERQLVAEWIREKLLHLTRQEVPHAIAVAVEGWRTREDGLVEIDAVVLVERESQKSIVIGKGGSVLKRVGTEAREEIERMLGARVFLKLFVKVRPEWRDDERTLRELGLG
jgi:GTP-binding protein Era